MFVVDLSACLRSCGAKTGKGKVMVTGLNRISITAAAGHTAYRESRGQQVEQKVVHTTSSFPPPRFWGVQTKPEAGGVLSW